MATERRGRKRINHNKLMKAYAYLILILLVVIGFVIGRVTKPVETKTVTVAKTVEVPTYEASSYPELDREITYFDVPLSHSLQDYLYEICADEDVPISLVLAMIEHESGFNPEVVSDTDDYGLMQINKINHSQLEEQYHCSDMLNPYQNVFCGVKIISGYITEYKTNYAKALMAYNMGDYGAKKAWENGIKSTSYSESILALMQKYEQEVNVNATNADAK